MRHDFIDKYSRGASFVHQLDARVKLVVVALLVVAVATTPGDGLIEFALLGIVPIAVCVAARVPLSHLFRKSLIVVPFLTVLGLFLVFSHRGNATYELRLGIVTVRLWREGLVLLGEVAAKTWITVLAMITFMAVTAFDMTLRGLQRMRCPGIIVALLAFMYRYIFLLVDEGERMTVARESRTVSMNAWRSLVSLSHLVGALFMRTFERGERIYSAMLSRGFTGEIMTVDVSRPARADAIALVVSAIYVVGVRYLGQFYGR